MNLDDWRIDYRALIRGAETMQAKRNCLGHGVSALATDIYTKLIQRPTLVDEIQYNSFWYGFDNYSWLELKGKAPLNENIQDRVVFVVGKSASEAADSAKKASSWLRGLIGSTELRFGPQYDKGHFMARSCGGGSQLNIFPQRRDINRAWSTEGKLFRQMETYCKDHPGTLCFSRPIYLEESLRPDAYDFGLLKEDGELWVAQFDNREIPRDGETFQNQISKGKELNAWRDALRCAAVNASDLKEQSEHLKRAIRSTPIGHEGAMNYERTILETLNYLFTPDLIDGELDVRTIDGTERRDIIFTNESAQTFWSYIRSEHSALFIMFEIKNTASIGAAALNQTAIYLGDRIGRFGFIVTRTPLGESAIRKAFSIYNDSTPRKIILVLSDKDIFEMIDWKTSGRDPTRYVQRLYREFKTTVQ